MHMWKKDIEEAILSDDIEKRKKASNIVKRLGDYVHEKFPEDMKYYKLETREIVHGENITQDMIDYVLCEPYWSLEQTNQVRIAKNYNVNEYNFNFMANLFYYKYSSVIDIENILAIAERESADAYHYWKLKAMKK